MSKTKPKTRTLTFACPASVEDRTVKKGGLKFNINPGPEGFLLKSKSREAPVGILIRPDVQHSEIQPISVFGVVKKCTLEFQDVAVPADRLADLEFLIREKEAVVDLLVETEHASLFDDDLDDQSGSGAA